MPPQSDLLERLSPRARKLARRVRDAWRAAKDFGDALGVALILGLIAGERFYDLLRRGAPWIFAAAMAGLASPATSGFGVEWLGRSTLATWLPVGILPLALIVVWFVRFSFRVLGEETKREERRRLRERKRPDLYKLLAKGRRDRAELNAPLELQEDLPKLDDLSFTHDLMADVARLLRTQYGIRDAGLVLSRERENKGFLVDVVKGRIDDRVKDKLQLGVVDRAEIEETLSERLRPLQYRHTKVEFGAGPRRYLLIAVSGATIPDDVRAEIDDTATLLVEDYVWAVRKPERKRKDA